MHLPVRPCAARCFAIGLFSAFVAFFVVPAYAQTEVSSDWPLKPSGLAVGDEFRLMSMGKNSRPADSTDIAVYDAHVQGRIGAIGHAEIKAYSSHFKVLGSTATVNARSHTGTTGSGGVPIYWLNGAKVADDYADFYDGSWTNRLSATLEDGTTISQNRRDQTICTGTADDGTTTNQPLGADPCTATTIGSTTNTLSGTTHSSSSSEQPRYLALSGVFRVSEDVVAPTIPVIESVAVTSDPGNDGEYVKDDAIEITATFSEAVAVTGTPKIKLKLNDASSADRASYDAADSTATELKFKYTVRAPDYSHDGINLVKNALILSGGTIKNQAGTVDASLTTNRTQPNSTHRIHIKPEVDSITVASTPASGTSYATGETIQIDLKFNRQVSVFTDFGTPSLTLILGGTPREAAYATTVGDDIVRFEYVVQAGDRDQDGISFRNNAIVWNDGAIIRKVHGDVDTLVELKLLRVAERGGTTSTSALAGHRVNAVDVLGVDVDPTSLTVAEGGDDYYSVFLTAQPSGTVTVTPSVTGSSDVTVNPVSLTFTTVNWSVSQDVTVSAAQDADADADTATIENTVSGADYGSVVADDVAVTVTEDEKVSSKVTLTVSAPTVAEDAGTTQVTVTGALNGIPLAAATVVTVSVGASGDTATEGTDYTDVGDLTLTIPEGQTSATVDFTLTPANDDIDEADEAVTIDGTVQSLTVTPATVTITDNDTRGVEVSPTTLAVAEGGNDTYTVVLSSEPTGPVTVTPSVTGSPDVTVSPSPLTFTAGNWDTTQTMTVSAVHDADADADMATIEHAVSGADYGSVNADDVAVTVTEDETQSSKVTLTVSAPTVAEDAGATQVTVTAELDEAPQASATVVTVSVGDAGDGATPGTDYNNVSNLTLAIPAGQTSAMAVFTLTVVNDDVDEDNEALTIGGAVTVQHLTVTPSTVTITDNDTRGLVFSVSPLSVPEDSSSTYTLALSSQPTATVTVAITGVTGTDLMLDDTSLTFTSSNWGQPQTVTVSSADDTDTLHDQVALTHTASGGDYQSLSADLPVIVVDDDVAMVVTDGVLVPSSPLSNRTYRLGETIRISVIFDQIVVVDTSGGVPVVKVPFTSLPNNRVVKDFEYASGSRSATLMFEYQVQSADRDDDGIDINNNALELNGGTIKDAWGRNADLGYTGSGELVNHRVDGSQTPNPASLTALNLTGITLDPAFNQGTTSYSVNVGYDVLMTRVRATPENNGTVTILPADADANAGGHQVALDTGVNAITITVRRDGRPDRTYTVTVTRASTTVSIAAGAPSATYRLEDVDFTVTRAETAGEPLEVGLTITQDQNFLAGIQQSPRVTIPANATSATLTLATSDFLGAVSADGRLTATVDAGDGYDVASPASAGVDLLVANPAVTLRLEKSSYAFLESAGTVTFNVVAETAPRVPVPTNLSLNVLVRDQGLGTATRGGDYTFQTRILPIVASDFAPSGGRYVATKSYSFAVLDDSTTEGEESFWIVLAGTGLPPAAVVTRADGATCGSLCFSEVVIADDESPPAQVSGVVLKPSQGALAVDWNAVAGATGYKVQWKSGTETFADAATDSREAIISSGSTTSYSISGLTDGTVYTVRVIATRIGAPGDGAASAEVTGKPGVPTLTIADAKATEGNAVEFTVTLDPASASDVTVEYATTDGTATADSSDADGADYTAPANGAQLTISANQTSGTISIATGDDTVDEDDETFTLTLSSPSPNAELGADKTATGTIENDDTDPAEITNFRFTNVPSSGVYGLGDVIEVSATFDKDVEVTGTPRIKMTQLIGHYHFIYADYDATASTDRVLAFKRPVTGDVDDSSDGLRIGADSLQLNRGTIRNKGTTVNADRSHALVSNGGDVKTRWVEGIEVTSTPDVSKTVTGTPVYGPGETVQFTVTFAGHVTVDTSSGTPALKFIASDGARQEAAYASGSGSAELVFTWTVPADVPGDEAPIRVPTNVGSGVTLLTDGGLVLNGGTIRDSSARDVNIRHGQYATASAADTTGPALAAGAEGATADGAELVLTFERAAGEAEHLDADSVPAAGDFAVGVQSVARTVSGVAVAGATVTLTLSNLVGHAQTVTVGYTPGTDALKDVWGNNAPGFSARSVRNDSPEPELSIDNVTVDEGGGTAEFTVTLGLASGEAVTVDYATSNGTALAGSDYTAASGTLTFAAGDTSKTIDVTVTDDSLGEEDEDFTVTLSNASNAGLGDGEATGTITDNEMPTLTIADATATEGASVSFTVALDPASSSDVTVAYATSDGTATADSADPDGADYTAPASGAQLTISANQTSGTISIATGADTVYEEDETFTVTLSSPSSNAELGTSKTATGTIENDDTDPAAITNFGFTNAPLSGQYGLGDVIEVSVTFDAAVDVAGTPRIALQLPGAPAADRYALYDDSASSDTGLVFRRTVTAAVDDMDGIGVGANALELNGGGIVNKDTTVAAVLDHDALSGGNIRTRIISGMEITSDPEVVAPAGYYGPGEEVEFTVTFAGHVTVDTSSGTPALKFIASDGARQEAAYASGSGSAELVFTWTVPADVPGDEAPIRVPTNVGSGVTLLTDGGLVLNGGTIRDSSARDVNIRHGQYATASAADTTGPALAAGAEGATADGAELVLTFERAAGEAEHLDADSVPAAGDFAVGVQSVARTVSGVAVAGATVTLTLSNLVGHAQTVTVGYTPGTDALKDVWGNNAPGFSARSVRNDSPEPELSIDNVTVDEGGGTAEFTVTLGLASGEAVTVDYATSNGTALAGSDYTAASGTLTFAAGDTSKTIDVTVTDDSLGEEDEDFTVTLSNASNAGLGDGEATGTITDNEMPTLTIADATATEGASVSFTVALDPASSSDVTVAYATSDGTATADSADPDGADYTAPASGAQLTISANQTSGTISIATGADTVYEEDETFTVTLSSPSSNAELGTSKTATGTIENDDAASADAALKALTMTADGSSVTLSPTFIAETYSYLADVENTVSSVSVAAEANHRKAAVAVTGGTGLAFGENTVTVRVTAEDGVTTQDYTVIVTRAPPTLAWAGQSTLSLEEDAGAVELTVTLTPASSDQVTVDYATLAAGATAGEDYTQASGTLTFAAGETQKTTTVTILDDTLYETGSVNGVLVELSNATGTAELVGGTTTIYLQIQDNESPPTATMENVTVDEGAGTMAFTLSLTHGIDTDIEYSADAQGLGGTATERVDYAAFFSETGSVNLKMPARQTSATFDVTILDDDVHEADETISMRWIRIGSAVATGSIDVTGTITNDDERGVEVSATTLTVPEGGDATYTVVLTSQPTGDVTVTPSVSGSSDVTVSPSPLTFTASTWAQAQTVTVSAAQDADAATDTATIGHAVAGGDYGANSVAAGDIAVTVSDDETVSTEVTLTVDPAAVDEGDDATAVTVTGTLNGGTRAAATVVTVSVGDAGDAATEGTDYGTLGSVTLTIAAGSTSGTTTFTLTPSDDDVDEGDEALTVDGSVTGLAVTAAELTIEEDDERGVAVTPTSLTVPEGESGTYTVVLTSQPTGSVAVALSRSGSSDVTVAPSPLTFTAGNWSTAQTVTVSAAADTDAVNDTATVTHAVSGGDYGSETASDVAVTVSDDETVSTEVTLTVDPAAVDEGDDATAVTVTGTLNGGTRAAATVVTVSVGAPVDGAVEGTDYATVNGFTLTIDAGLTTGTQAFTLTPADDDVDEANEALTVAGSTTATGFTVNPTAVTIADDDERGVEVGVTALTVSEGGDATYTVVLESEPTGNVTVTPSVSGNTEVTVSGTLTFTPSDWAQAQTVTVSAAQDADAATDTATIGHAVSGGDYGVNSVTADDIAVTVDDDETVSTEVTLTVDPAAVDEGDDATTVTVTGTLNGGTRAAATVVTVSVGAPVDGAVEGTDYATVNGFTLTIDAGLTTGTQTFTLTPADDDVDEANEALTVAGSTTATGFTVNPTTVTIADDDERGVEVGVTALTVSEGGDATYTVVLESEPTGNVTVTPSVSGNTEVTVSGTLTFTPSDWAQAQTVTVSAAQDADAATDTATIGHAVSGGDYGVNSVTAGDIAVTVDDDETVSTEVTLTVDPAAVDEGDDATAVTVTGTLNGGTRAAATVVTVSVGAPVDGAVEGTDYATVNGFTLTIDAGLTTGTQAFTLTPADDDVDEANEALTVAGSTTATGFTVNPTAVTIADDDERGVEVGVTALTVSEGGDATYTVVLESEPTGNVTVTPSVSGNTEVTVSGTLTFTPSDWAQAQTVTVSAAQDADAATDTATIGHAVSGGDYGVNSVTADDIAVTVDDDETVSTEVTLTVDPAAVDEGDDATAVTVTGTLNGGTRAAATVVTVSVGDAGDAATEGTDYGTLGSVTLTIAAGSTSGTTTFTLTPSDDDVDEGDEALTVDGSVTGLAVTAAELTIEEDDERGVTVTPTSLTVPEGESGTYTVVLTSQPTGSVAVALSRSGSSDVTVAPSPLTFTAGNWSTAQTVTVSAAADTDAVNDTVTVTHAVSGGDYGSETASDVAVTVSDDETVSTEVTLTVDPAAVDEGDDATAVTVTGTLNGGTRAAATVVTVSVGDAGDAATEGTDYGTLGSVTLTIAAGSTSGTTTFTLTPSDDDVDEGDEALTVDGSVTGLAVTAAELTIEEDDERGVAVTPTSLTVPEGESGTYTVVLTSQPTGSVAVALSRSGSSDVTVAPSPLTFTAGSWSTAQTVTVSAAADTDAVNDTATVTHAVSGGDYGSETASDVAVTVSDDETVSTEVTLTVDPAAVDEGDDATAVTVTGTLNGGTRAAATVVTVSVGAPVDGAVEGTDYATVNGFTLTIDAGLTTGTQAFTLTPADDDVDEANEALTVAGSTTATGFTVNPTAVTIADDDERGVEVGVTALTVSEGGDATYTVVLESEPTGNVTVTPSVSGNTEVTVSGTLTFTPSDWAQAQTVTVSAAQDADAATDTATIGHAVSGGDYVNSVTADDTVTVDDDETVSTEVTLTVDPAAVDEGDDATAVTVTGTLNGGTRAAATVVTVSVGDAGDAATEGTDYGTLGSVTLTIAAGSTSGTTTFTLTPSDDDVDEGDEALTVDGSVTGLAVTAAELTIEEDDERGVAVTPTSLTVPEGESGTYTVVLTSQPTGSVAVALSRSGSSDVTVAPSPLTFTAGNWSTAQTVTVSAAADTDAVNDTATVTHAVSGGDYGSETASDVAVTVSDDETVSTEVTLTVDPAAVDEGDDATAVTVTGTLNGGTRAAATVVTVSVGAPVDGAVEGTDYATVNGFTLTIDAGLTTGTQAFTLTPADDDVDEANEALTVAGSTTATGFTVNPTAVTIADDDERGVEVGVTALTVSEGGDATYTVVLESEPTGNVTVTPSVSGNTEVTVSGTLTFTPSDWAQAQTVTVSAAQDADAATDTATIGHAVSGGDYGVNSVTADDIAVTVDDDETVSTEVTLTVDPAAVDEGDDATAVTVTGTLNGGTRAAATVVTVSVGAPVDGAVEGPTTGR